MSERSEAVKRWRKRTKERLVEAFGGKCSCCGYAKCVDVLRFHHLDPETKETEWGGYRACIKSWDSIIKEMRKCVMVCSNCHIEIHSKAIEVPEDAARFNEEFADYRGLESADRFDLCPVCGKRKSVRLISCSRECAARRARHVDWDSVDLEKMLKGGTIVSVADKLGVSEMSVRKRAKKIGIR